MGIQLLRELPSVTIHGPLCQTHSHHPTLSLLGASSSSRSALDSPHPTHSQPRFPSEESQISRSIKPFIPSTVTQTQLEPVPLRRDPTKAFIPELYSLHNLSTEKLWLLILMLQAPALALGAPHPAVPQIFGSLVVQRVTGHILQTLWAPTRAQPAACKPRYLHQVCPSAHAECSVVTGI